LPNGAAAGDGLAQTPDAEPKPARAAIPRTATPAGGVVSASRPKTNPGAPPIARTPTNPAMAAAAVKEKLKSEAENVGLNAVAMVKETWFGFQKSNRYFKYKVFIVLAWAVLAGAGLFVAWPESDLKSDRMGARLYQPESGGNVFMIKNEGEKTWTNVLILVNRVYRLAAPNISPLKDVTFNPKQLIGPDGVVAPPELVISAIELRTDDGQAMLLVNGVEQQ
jgi:hypothetical protein